MTLVLQMMAWIVTVQYIAVRDNATSDGGQYIITKEDVAFRNVLFLFFKVPLVF